MLSVVSTRHRMNVQVESSCGDCCGHDSLRVYSAPGWPFFHYVSREYELYIYITSYQTCLSILVPRERRKQERILSGLPGYLIGYSALAEYDDGRELGRLILYLLITGDVSSYPSNPPTLLSCLTPVSKDHREF